ncbi:MAG TPA: J domain-containing protein [Vicinamibacterales bacterium]|nr:J domain-containing protein [Vicinamibacterales bacterium]
MREPPDRLARAYATLGLQRGCSPREAARRYRSLVKRWHPDQYANDPQGQVEAAQRMREINRAFAIVRGAQRGDIRHGRVASDTMGEAVPHTSARFFGQRLSEADLREIADSMRESSMAGMLARYLAWGGSVAYGLILIAQPGRPKSAMNSMAGVLLLGGAAAYGVYATWFRNR